MHSWNEATIAFQGHILFLRDDDTPELEYTKWKGQMSSLNSLHQGH